MELIATKIQEVFIIKPDVYNDNRGYFLESYNEKVYQSLGINFKFVQDNQTFSKQGAIRGLHYQIGESAQGKLARVLYGKVLDVAVDIRFGSPTFGQHVAVELTSENNLQFWIPPGFAHGISVLSEIAVFSYKCTAYYSKENEKSIIYNDKDLAINWKVHTPIVSKKDMMGKNFKDITRDFNYSK